MANYERTWINSNNGLEVAVSGDPYALGAKAVAETAFAGGDKLKILAQEHPTAVRVSTAAAIGAVVFVAALPLEQALGLGNTVFAEPPSPADCQKIINDLVQKTTRTSAENSALQTAIDCAAKSVETVAAMTRTPNPLTTPIPLGISSAGNPAPNGGLSLECILGGAAGIVGGLAALFTYVHHTADSEKQIPVMPVQSDPIIDAKREAERQRNLRFRQVQNAKVREHAFQLAMDACGINELTNEIVNNPPHKFADLCWMITDPTHQAEFIAQTVEMLGKRVNADIEHRLDEHDQRLQEDAQDLDNLHQWYDGLGQDVSKLQRELKITDDSVNEQVWKLIHLQREVRTIRGGVSWRGEPRR